jgi:hypothetical protein
VSLTEILAILALTIYAIYRQTRVDEIVGKTRFKMAIIYGIVGVCVGGFGQGFGEVLVMIALMIAVQAELVWRRAQALTAGPGAEAGPCRRLRRRRACPKL